MCENLIQNIQLIAIAEPSPEPAMAASSTTRLFGTFELMEMVLLDLEMRELLLNQRVSKSWQAIIRNSPLLQRRLFLNVGVDPRTASEIIQDHREINPLLADIFHLCRMQRTCAPFQPRGAPAPHESKRLSLSIDLVRLDATDYPEASWRSMFWFQPPQQKVYISDFGSTEVFEIVEALKGLRMGELIDSVLPHRRLHRGGKLMCSVTNPVWHNRCKLGLEESYDPIDGSSWDSDSDG